MAGKDSKSDGRVQTKLLQNPGYYDDVGQPLDYDLDDYLADKAAGKATEEAAAFELRIRQSSLVLGTYNALYQLAASEKSRIKSKEFGAFPVPHKATVEDFAWFLKEVYDLETTAESVEAFGDGPALAKEALLSRLETLRPWVAESLELNECKDYLELLAMESPEVRDQVSWATYGYWLDRESENPKVPKEYAARRGIISWLKKECTSLRKHLGLRAPKVPKGEVTRIDPSKATDERKKIAFSEVLVNEQGDPYLHGSTVYRAGQNLDADYETSYVYMERRRDDEAQPSTEERSLALMNRLGDFALEFGDGLVMDAIAEIITERGFELNPDGTLKAEPITSETDLDEYVENSPYAISTADIWDAIRNMYDPHKQRQRSPLMLQDIQWALQRLQNTWEITIYNGKRVEDRKALLLSSHGVLHYKGDKKETLLYTRLVSFSKMVKHNGRLYIILERVPVQYVMSDAWGQYRYIPAEAAAPPNLLRSEMKPYVASMADALHSQVSLWNDRVKDEALIIRQDDDLRNVALMREIAVSVIRQAEAAAKAEYPRPITIDMVELAEAWLGMKYRSDKWPKGDKEKEMLRNLRRRVAQDLVNLANWEHPRIKSIEYKQGDEGPGYFVVRLQSPRQPEIEYERPEPEERPRSPKSSGKRSRTVSEKGPRLLFDMSSA